MSTDVHLLVLSTLLGLAVQSAAQLNARYRLQPGQVGSLCSGLTPGDCRKDVPYVLTRSVVECAIRCTKHPGCKSFSFQIRPNSARHTHRCEMAPDKVHTIQVAAKNGSGYEYYKNVS
ncbi:uncharacterized protein LOC124282814 isoform X1 [Haliotis rubra]|uniref:uncharacterized protein LOC124282814 isoform X1 n=1 Tax=Haliotis rubra TaxID=36100 RepID=UPI001EE51DD3|nr:uncharacterized protein LOC124282814 isoform X1 [Haliotis rubra]